jgi:hypothetical protein
MRCSATLTFPQGGSPVVVLSATKYRERKSKRGGRWEVEGQRQGVEALEAELTIRTATEGQKK